MSFNEKKQVMYGPKQLPWDEQLPSVAKGLVSPPQQSPIEVYNRRNFAFSQENELVSGSSLEIPPNGQTSAEQDDAFKQMQKYVNKQSKTFLGYQTEEKISYQKRLSPFLDTSLNNVGDPFVNGNYTVNTKFAERNVLDYYASLWNAKWPSEGPYIDEKGQFQPGDPQSYWGYVLTMGSTEGNLYGMLNARDYLSGKMLLVEEIKGENKKGEEVTRSQIYSHSPIPPSNNANAYTPVAFFSADTHYSIVKAMSVEKIETFGSLGNREYPGQNPVNHGQPWPTEVESQTPSELYPAGDGTIDIDKLISYVTFFAEKGYPILVVLNYGTTFKGAYDDINTATARLKKVFSEYNLLEREVPVDPNDPSRGCELRTGYWIHIDGALGANYMPFVKMAAKSEKYQPFFEHAHCSTGPDFDFRNEMVHSIVASGHKWPGAPWPTGIYMTRQKFMVTPPDNPEYIGSPDTTFAGSRSGVSPLVLWEYFARNSYQQQIEMAMRGQEMAIYAHEKLKEVAEHWRKKGADLPKDLWLQRSPMSLSLIFCQPNDDIIFKYSLAKESPVIGGLERKYVHLFTMWDVSKSLINKLCKDLKKDNAFNPSDFEELKNVHVSKSLPEHSYSQSKVPLKGRSFR